MCLFLSVLVKCLFNLACLFQMIIFVSRLFRLLAILVLDNIVLNTWANACLYILLLRSFCNLLNAHGFLLWSHCGVLP